MTFPNGREGFYLGRLGNQCTAVISGVTTTFNGILDIASSIQYDSAGQPVYVLGTHLTVEIGIANRLVRNQVITIDGVQYQLRDTNPQNDPYVTLLDLAKVTA